MDRWNIHLDTNKQGRYAPTLQTRRYAPTVHRKKCTLTITNAGMFSRMQAENQGIIHSRDDPVVILDFKQIKTWDHQKTL